MALNGLNGFIDVLFGWTLQFPLVVSIFILALILTLITNIAYKFLTDQNEMKRLKDKQKELQKKYKSLKDKPKKQLEVQQKMMEVNTKYMGKSMKPTLFTLIPLLFVFGWMSANLAFVAVDPGMPVTVFAELDLPAQVTFVSEQLTAEQATKDTVEQEVRFAVSGPQGTHPFTLTSSEGGNVTGVVIVGDKATTKLVQAAPPFDTVTVEYPKATPFGSFSIFGYRPGWLFTYALFSIILSLLTRKLLKLS